MDQTPNETFVPHGKPPARWKLFLPFALLFLVLLGVSGFWFVVSRSAGNAVETWIAREQAVGRVWNCPDRVIGGFPFRIEVSCVRPTFTSNASTSPLAGGSLGRIIAVSQIYTPDLVIVEADGPLILDERGSGRRVELNWDTLRSSLRGRPGEALVQFALQTKAPTVRVTGPGITEARASATAFDFYLRRDPERFKTESAFDLSSSITGFAAPGLDEVLGPGLAQGDVQAVITQAAPFAASSPPTELERWRNDGGRILLNTLKLSKGERRVEATGNLGLDPEHRPDGKIDIGIAGVEGLLKSFGVRPEMAGLLGIKVGKAGELTRIPLKISKGALSLGPLALVQVQPLY